MTLIEFANLLSFLADALTFCLITIYGYGFLLKIARLFLLF